MNAELNHVVLGFLAHVLGGLIAGWVGWFGHLIYERRRRKKYHAQFDRDILEFAHTIQAIVTPEQMPELMAHVVPLASKARFGVDTPPLKEEHTLPPGAILHCKICKRSITPTTAGRCKTCKLGCGLWHEDVQQGLVPTAYSDASI